jgi:hypothetical protein
MSCVCECVPVVIKSQLERLPGFSNHKAQNTFVPDSAHVELILRRQFHFLFSNTEKHVTFDDVKHERHEGTTHGYTAVRGVQKSTHPRRISS